MLIDDIEKAQKENPENQMSSIYVEFFKHLSSLIEPDEVISESVHVSK